MNDLNFIPPLFLPLSPSRSFYDAILMKREKEMNQRFQVHTQQQQRANLAHLNQVFACPGHSSHLLFYSNS